MAVAQHFLIFLLVAIPVFCGLHFGVKRMMLGVGLAAVGALAASFIPQTDQLPGWLSAAAAALLGAAAGGGLAYAPANAANRSRMHAVWQTFWRDRRKLVVALACGAATVLTIKFANLASAGSNSFWYGFYQSWTAGFVAFLLFGLATTVASLAKPEEDGFERRVRILFGGRTGAHIDYIVAAVAKIGYYAEIVEREYCIDEVDTANHRYSMLVTHRSTNRHYIHDAESVDTLEFAYLPDPVPQMETAGELISVVVCHENGHTTNLTPPEGVPIPVQGGMAQKWDIAIPKGQAVSLALQYRVWCLFGEEQSFEPNRFAKAIRTTIKRTCPGAGVTLAAWRDDLWRHEKNLIAGRDETLPAAIDCAPERAAYKFTLTAGGRPTT